jgi:hypothetical protein
MSPAGTPDYPTSLWETLRFSGYFNLSAVLDNHSKRISVEKPYIFENTHFVLWSGVRNKKAAAKSGKN